MRNGAAWVRGAACWGGTRADAAHWKFCIIVADGCFSPQALRSGEEALHDPEAIRAIFLLIIVWAVIFWRAAIKLIVIASMLLAVLGALTIVQGLH
jgi:hypothetical protein